MDTSDHFEEHVAQDLVLKVYESKRHATSQPTGLEDLPDELLVMIVKNAGTDRQVRKMSRILSLVSRRMHGVGVEVLYAHVGVLLNEQNCTEALEAIICNSHLAKKIKKMTLQTDIGGFRVTLSPQILSIIEKRFKQTTISRGTRHSVLYELRYRGLQNVCFLAVLFTPNLVKLSVSMASHLVRVPRFWPHALGALPRLKTLEHPACLCSLHDMAKLPSLEAVVLHQMSIHNYVHRSTSFGYPPANATYSLTRFELLWIRRFSPASHEISTFLSHCICLSHCIVTTRDMYERSHYPNPGSWYDEPLDCEQILQALLPCSSTLETFIIMDIGLGGSRICQLLKTFPNLTKLAIPVDAVASSTSFDESLLDILPLRLRSFQLCGMHKELGPALMNSYGLLDRIFHKQICNASGLHYLRYLTIFFIGRRLWSNAADFMGLTESTNHGIELSILIHARRENRIRLDIDLYPRVNVDYKEAYDSISYPTMRNWQAGKIIINDNLDTITICQNLSN